MKKKMLSIILSLAMLLQVCGIVAFAEPDAADEMQTAQAELTEDGAEIVETEDGDISLAANDEVYFPDEAVRKYMLDPQNGFDVNGDGKLSEYEATHLPVNTSINLNDCTWKYGWNYEPKSVVGLDRLCAVTPQGEKTGIAFDFSNTQITEGVAQLIAEGYWSYILLDNTPITDADLQLLVDIGAYRTMDYADWIMQSQKYWPWSPEYAETHKEIVDVNACRHISLRGTAITNIKPFLNNTFRVEGLDLSDSQVQTLAGLEENKTIMNLYLSGTQITDFLPLQNRYLQNLDVSDTAFSDGDLRYLEHVNKIPADQPVDPVPYYPVVTIGFSFSADNTSLTDLSGLKGVYISNLYINNTQVSDLSPLINNMPGRVYADNTNISDISMLADGAWDRASFSNTFVEDLSVFELRTSGASLQNCRISDITPLAVHVRDNKAYRPSEFNLYGNLIDFTNADNLNTQNWLNANGNRIGANNQFPNPPIGKTMDFASGAKIVPSLKLDKKYFDNGDSITATLTLENKGTAAANLDVTFDFEKKTYNWADGSTDGTVTPTNSGDVQQTASIAPGATVTKTITVTPRGFHNQHSDALYFPVRAKIFDGTTKYNAGGTVAIWNGYQYCYGASVTAGEASAVAGRCRPDTVSVQIVSKDDGVVLGNAMILGTAFYNPNLPIPPKYYPSTSEERRSLPIKAICTSKTGQVTELEANITIYRTILRLNDYSYIMEGSGHRFGKTDNAIFYYGDTMKLWAKIEAKGLDTIQSVSADVDGKTVPMTLVSGGRYDGYYTCTTDPIQSTGLQVPITLKIKMSNGSTQTIFLTAGKVIIDPSGIITDSATGQPIAGVKVTLYEKQEDGSWETWKAEEYLQQNPVYTNSKGYYGWDVPEGTYRIVAEKEGYTSKDFDEYVTESGTTEKIIVPPPRLDVHFTMDPIAGYVAPTLDDVKAMVTTAVEGLKTTTLEPDKEAVDVEELINEQLPEKWGVYFQSSEKTASTKTEQGKIEGKLAIYDVLTGEVYGEPYDAAVSLLTDANAEEGPSSAQAVSGGYIGVASQGAPFETKLKASGSGSYTFEAIDGMPAGITLSADGTVSGMPTQMGTYPFICIRMTDGAGKASEVYNMRLPVLKQRVDFTVTNNVVAHDGQPHKATVVPTDSSLGLVEGTDYEVLYGGQSEQTDAGTYAITVKMIGNAYHTYATGKLSLKTLVIRPSSGAKVFQMPTPAAMTE